MTLSFFQHYFLFKLSIQPFCPSRHQEKSIENLKSYQLSFTQARFFEEE